MNSGLAKKIAALRAKTIGNGCTEAEALAAADMARRLMVEHGLDEKDLSITEAREKCAPAAPPLHRTIGSAVAHCTNTAAMEAGAAKGVLEIIFVGRDPGPEIALYLRDLAIRAVNSAFLEFRSSSPAMQHRLRSFRDRAEMDFTDHCARRIAVRLVEAFAPQHDPVALSQAVVALDRAYPGSVRMRQRRGRVRNASAAMAGIQAANAVGLHHGVSTPSRTYLEHGSRQ